MLALERTHSSACFDRKYDSVCFDTPYGFALLPYRTFILVDCTVNLANVDENRTALLPNLKTNAALALSSGCLVVAGFNSLSCTDCSEF